MLAKPRNRQLLLMLAAVILVSLLGVWFFSNSSGLDTEVALAAMSVFARNILLLCIFTGVCAMATVEFVKRTAVVRGRYHLKALLEMVGQPAVDAVKGALARTPATLVGRFDLPVGVLIAQLSTTVDAEIEQLKVKAQQRPGGLAAGLEGAVPSRWLVENQGEAAVVPLLLSGKFKPLKESPEREFDSFATLESAVESSLDDLQALTAAGWRWRVRSWACVVSAVYGLAVLVFLSVGPGAKAIALTATFVIGGYFSWLAHDLAALAEHRRT